MAANTLETDYLIIGGGAAGLCVADELVRHGTARHGC